MKKPELIILAGSAGSFKIIFEIIRKLPKQFQIPVLVVIHRGKEKNNNIEEILSKTSNLIVKQVSDKDEIEKGIIYLAPPDYHLLVEKDKVFSLDISEPVMFSRPCIDITFESAADVYKKGIMAFLFSGANKDGAKGLLKIKNQGGFSYVQHPIDAEVDTMPLAAIELNACTEILHTKEIEALILSFS
ncbi:MAG: chemotaxis protein CheB [Pelobium sp.]